MLILDSSIIRRCLGRFRLLTFTFWAFGGGRAIMAAPPIISGIKTRPFVDNWHSMKLTPAYGLAARADGIWVCIEALPQFKLIEATGALILIEWHLNPPAPSIL
jgi:hypothetical protein